MFAELCSGVADPASAFLQHHQRRQPCWKLLGYAGQPSPLCIQRCLSSLQAANILPSTPAELETAYSTPEHEIKSHTANIKIHCQHMTSGGLGLHSQRQLLLRIESSLRRSVAAYLYQLRNLHCSEATAIQYLG